MNNKYIKLLLILFTLLYISIPVFSKNILIKKIDGTVQIKQSEDASWKTAKQGQELTPGYFIFTGFNSTAIIKTVNAEVEVTDKSAEQIATNILAKKAQWISICVKVEKIRLGAKHKIDNVLSEQEVLQIRNDTIETLNNL